MKIKEITQVIEKYAPLDLKEEFDTPGLCLGDENKEIKKVLVSENVTFEVLNEAILGNFEMIVSHHPVIFGEYKNEYIDKIIEIAKAHSIALYSAHTNLDSTKGGINDAICDILDIHCLNTQTGCYRIGYFKNEISLGDLIEKSKKVFLDNNIKSIGDLNRICKKVCVSSGACARDEEFIDTLKKEKIDVFISGEVKISSAIMMKDYNIAYIDVNHYESEKICMDIFEKILNGIDITVAKSKADISPYNQ